MRDEILDERTGAAGTLDLPSPERPLWRGTSELAPGRPPVRGRRVTAGGIVRMLAAVYALALGFPLFFHYNGRVYRGADLWSAEVLPISPFVGFTVVLLSSILTGRLATGNRYLPAVLALVVGSGALYVVSDLANGGSVNPQLWGLYSATMVTGLFGGTLLARSWSVGDFLRLFAYPVAAVATLHVVYSIATLGVIASFTSFERGAFSIFGLFSIYQKVVYYPLVLTLALLYFLLFDRGLWWRWTAVVFLMVDLTIVAAREPFVFITVFVLIHLLWKRRPQNVVPVLVAAAIFVGGATVYWDKIEDFYIVKKFSTMVQSDKTDGRTANRAAMIRRQAGEIRDGLVVGNGFVMNESARWTPHNQYLEYTIRGGLLYAIPVVLILIAVGRRAALLSRYDPRYGYFAVTFAVLLLVSFNINTAMRAPYASMVIWTMVGFVGASSLPGTRGSRTRGMPPVADCALPLR